MSSRRNRTWLLAALTVVAACSVFPDEAPPAPLDGADAGAAGQRAGGAEGGASGGTELASTAGAAGDPGLGGAAIVQAGAAGEVTGAGMGGGGTSGGGGGKGGGGVGGSGGVGGKGGAGGSGGKGGSGGMAGGGGTQGGAGGQGGACNNPRQVRAAALADTWIGSAKTSANHGSEAVLSVVAGSDEHRALVALSLPAALSGGVLARATLRFHLQSNADVGKAARSLVVYNLTRTFDEAHATWEQASSGSKNQWSTWGGDYDLEWAKSALLAGTTSGNVDFDVTAAVKPLLGAAAIPISLILIESSAARPAPAELAFGAREGNASQIPELLLSYCDP